MSQTPLCLRQSSVTVISLVSIRERVSGSDSLTLSPPRPVCTLYHISHGEFAVIALFLAHFIPFFRLEGTTPRRRFSRQKVILTLFLDGARDPFACTSGRLYQVEYAMEAIGHAGTCLGMLASDGVLLAAERKNTNKLLDEVIFSEKIYRLHE